MTKQVQRRRGTSTQHTGFTGADGEISVNTTNKSVHVHDGSTAGGFEAARADLNNVTGSDVASSVSGETVSSLTITSADINGGTIDGTTIGGSTPAAGSFTSVSVTGTVDGRDVAADGTKLDGIESGATADQTAGEIKTAYESNADTNAFTDAEQSKLSGIEASADVTDTANVTAAGALMDSELTDIAAVKALNQGVATTDSPSFAGLTATTADINGGTIDGVTIGGASAGAITATTITGSGDMNIDSGTLFVDASTNNVGIGTASPSTILTLKRDSAGQSQIDYPLLSLDNGNANGFSQLRFADDGAEIASILSNSADKYLLFRAGGSTERMRIDSSGNLLVGKTSASLGSNGAWINNSGTSWFDIASDYPLGVNRRTTDGALVQFRKDNSTVGSIGHDTYGLDIDGNTGYLGLNVNDTTDANTGVEILSRSFSSVPRMSPNGDNKLNLGDASKRWKTVYAVTGTINQSDRNEKQDIEELSEAEQRVAVACKGLMRKFRWIDAVEEKGDDARIHFGIIAQDLQAAFEAEGLDPNRYGMFCSDTWWETYTDVPAVEAQDAVYETVTDEEGNETQVLVSEAVEAKEAYTRTDTYDTEEEAPSGATKRTRLGVRYSQLLAFIIAAI